MAKISLLCLICVVLMSSFSDAYKLFVVFSYPGKSHGILGEAYVRHLLKAGHEVTYVAAVPIKESLPGLRQIDVSENFNIYPAEAYLNITAIMQGEMSLMNGHKHFMLTTELMNATIRNEEVQRIMMDPQEHFDAVIAEWLLSELHAGYAPVFGCPFIWSSSMEPHSMVLTLIDELPNPAYVPGVISENKLPYGFVDRVKELLVIPFMDMMKWFIVPLENQIYNEGYGPAAAKRGRQLPSFDVAKYNASLMLGNSHVSSGNPTQLPPSYKAIGGYHIDKKTKPLPKDLQQLMDKSKNGVVYFSLGTMVKSKQLPAEIKAGILEVLGALKQTVIWKFEENLPNVPKNVHIVQWAPQQSILAHPNCVLFITHGGLLSTTEALHFGVPIIGIPFFGDQFKNINNAESKGFGKRVNLNYDLPANLKVAIDEILGTPAYRERVKELSFIYHHRTVSPEVELVHWVEHVIKTNGAPHLRSPALSIPFYQKMYLDLAAVILVIIILIKYALKFLFSSKKTDLNKKNK